MKRESIVLGGGCFWCIEAVFVRVEGVIAVTSGYAGGFTPDPTYEDVSTGMTGHAEVVEVVYDPDAVTLPEILDVFFTVHDPTSLNRQGADVGSQYRSMILYDSEEQRLAVQDYIETIKNNFDRPLVTEIKALSRFYAAEEYHQKYYEQHPGQGYCQIVIAPKLRKAAAKSGLAS
jgi:methionine-S-sulfoxide reductase